MDLVKLSEAAKITGKSRKFLREKMEEGSLSNHGTKASPKFIREELDPYIDDDPEFEKEPDDPEFPFSARIIRERKSTEGKVKVDTTGGQMSPEDRYESWRVDPGVWQPGQTLLYIRIREVNSQTFVSANPPYLAEMPHFSDLCDQFPDGGVIEVSIKGPPHPSTGQRKLIRGPLIIMIAPKGESVVSGFGNPYSYTGRNGSQQQNPAEWLKFFQLQNEQMRKDQQSNQNQWINLLGAMGSGKKEDGSGFMQMMMYMQHQDRIAQRDLAIAQANANKQFLVGITGAVAPIITALLTKDNNKPDHMLTLVIESIKSASEASNKQSEILLKAALGEKDFNKQLEMFEKFKALSGDDSTLGELGKFFDASGLGGALTTLAEAGASRLSAGGSDKKQAPLPIEQGQVPPNPYQNPMPQPNPQTIDGNAVNQQAQQQQVAQAADQIKVFLQLIHPAFKNGKDPKALAAEVWEGNKQHKEQFLTYTPDQVVSTVQQFAPFFGYKDLSGRDAADFIGDFAREMKSLAEKGV